MRSSKERAISRKSAATSLVFGQPFVWGGLGVKGYGRDQLLGSGLTRGSRCVCFCWGFWILCFEWPGSRASCGNFFLDPCAVGFHRVALLDSSMNNDRVIIVTPQDRIDGCS